MKDLAITESIKDFMTTEIISIDNEAKIYDAIKKMVEHDIGSIVVKKGEQFVGILTERDILKRCCSEHTTCTSLTVEKIMSSPLKTVEANAPIGKAAKIMDANNIRRLLVEKDGKIVGIITQKDITRETLNIFLAFQSIS